MSAYLTRHLQVLFSTLGSLLRTPLASLTTILIIAVTLLLPTLFYIAVKSAQQISGTWQGRPQISIFLEQQISDNEAQLIYDEIRLHPAIAVAEFISPQQALQEFKSLSGLDAELTFLDDNPLPSSIVIMPGDDYIEADRLLALRDELAGFDGIEDIRLDLDWIDRFNSIVQTASRVAQLLSGLLGLALILIVGNTIKLLILNRRHEIEVTRLVGGSNTFVRRPFLYFGTLFGLFGALTMFALLLAVAHFLHPPLSQLAALYQQNSLISPLMWREIGAILGIGMLLGWLAARWSVAQHLRHIKPR